MCNHNDSSVRKVEEYLSELFRDTGSDPGSVSYDGMLENLPWKNIKVSP